LPDECERQRRLFFALWPDEGVRIALARIARALPRRRGRLVPASNLHMTAVFVGATDARTCDSLQARAGDIDAREFFLTLTHIGYFSRSRILRLGADECPAALTDLVRQLNTCLTVCALTPELRPFRPHVTLRRDAAPLSTDLRVPPVKWSVHSFCLMASETRPEGARYEILRQFALQRY
jgi:2'-5' RNA ligase